MSLIASAWIIARKDFLVEVRSREMIYTTLFFALSCVLVFAFAFVPQGKPIPNAAAGVLWVAIAFSGTLALGRAFERERQSETLRALLLAPIERASVYLGKLIALLALLALTEMLLVPVVGLLFHAPLGRQQLCRARIDRRAVRIARPGTVYLPLRDQLRDLGAAFEARIDKTQRGQFLDCATIIGEMRRLPSDRLLP